MLYLISGTPGASKTLNTIKTVWLQTRDKTPSFLDRLKFLFLGKELPKQQEKRTVYYHGIKGLAPWLGWIELSDDDARKWYELPKNSIFIFDEAYTLFPAWGQRKEPDEHIKRVATHRHDGHDIYMIFQDPSKQMGDFLKGLVESHTHYERIGGSKTIRVLRWNSYQGSVRSNQARRDAVSSVDRIDPKIFSFYNSASEHTDKFRFHWKPFAALAVCLIAGFVAITRGVDGVAAVTSLHDEKPETAIQQETLQDQIHDTLRTNEAKDVLQSKRLEPTPDNLLHRFEPRVKDMQWTAPAYDEFTKPRSAPRPAACMKSEKGCFCYTQQATLLIVSEFFCESHVAGNYFDHTVPDVRTHDQQQIYTPPPAPSKPPQEAVYDF